MTTFRFNVVLFGAFLFTLGACSSNKRDDDVERLQAELQELRNELQVHQDVESQSDDVQPTGIPSQTATPPESLFGRLSSAAPNLAEQAEKEKLIKDVASLKRQAELDSINRYIEETASKKRECEQNERLGLSCRR